MLRAALAALLLSATPLLAQEAGIEIHDPYAITPRPGATTGAAYMLIHNHATTPDRLVGVTSPAAARVELHTSAEEDGVMRMGPVDGGLELRAGGLLVLERGGEHVMFMGLTAPWQDGDTIPLTLVFENAGEVRVEVPVEQARLTGDGADAPDATDMDHEDGMDMGHGDGAMDHGSHADGQGG